jgi:hypothetical protein
LSLLLLLLLTAIAADTATNNTTRPHNVGLTDYYATSIMGRDILVRIRFLLSHLFICWLVHSFIHSFIHTYIHSFIHSLISNNYLNRLCEHERVGGRINIRFLFLHFRVRIEDKQRCRVYSTLSCR